MAEPRETPTAEQNEVELRDRSMVTIRPITKSDRQLLQEAFARLSDASRRRRFLVPANSLSDEDLSYLTDLDHARHEALVALEAETGEAVGVARYVRVPGDRESGEVAVAVVDEWQGRGLATVLLSDLTERARQNGLRRYTALVSKDNEVVLDVLDRLGAVRFGETANGEIEYGIDFPAEGIGDRLRGALGAAAAGQLDLLAGLVRRLAVWRRG